MYCLLLVPSLHQSKIILFDFGSVPTVRYFIFFYFHFDINSKGPKYSKCVVIATQT